MNEIEYMGSQSNNSILGHFQYTPEEKWMLLRGGVEEITDQMALLYNQDASLK